MATLTLMDLLQLAAAVSGYPATEVMPHVEYVSPCRMIQRYEAKRYSAAQCEVRLASGEGVAVGLYMEDTNTVWLRKGWNHNTPWGASVVVHEFVHYLQDINGKNLRTTTRCVLETEAYKAQNIIYRLSGSDYQISHEHIHTSGRCPN